jgi:hypothetical protein
MAEPQPVSRHLALKAFAYGLAKYIGAPLKRLLNAQPMLRHRAEATV